MKPLTETFRPAKLAEIRGQSGAVKLLTDWRKHPSSKAWIFHGEPGCGKTSAAYALASELGCDVNGTQAEQLSSGFWIIPSGKQSVEAIKEVFEHCRYRPMNDGCYWWVILLNEGDCASPQAKKFWHDQLEQLPTKTIVIFTSNEFDGFPASIRERCTCVEFVSDAEQLWQDAQELVRHVWETSLGHNHCPTLETLGFKKSGRLSFRAVVKAVEPLILAELPEEPDNRLTSPPLQFMVTEAMLEAVEPVAPVVAPEIGILEAVSELTVCQPEFAIGDRVISTVRAGSRNEPICGIIKDVKDDMFKVSGFWLVARELQHAENLVLA